MDFEGLLTHDALRPLMSEFALHLMDHSDTASLISRLPPPKMAMLYHAALLRSSTAVSAQGEFTHGAERLCASVLDAYALRDGGVKGETPGMDGARMRSVWTITAEEAPAAMIICPALCQRLVEAEGKHPFLEEALAAREARLQHRIVTLAAGVAPASSISPASPAPP
ncbi:hypothetical protein CGC21_12540 [Leishmania donovani]|uniref:Uncharacterized protein n=1 Tax=Leishmania donovani TaxID=5661 RepID=A0A3Q8IGW4_LEIDO|nr:hypothetical protein LdCL_360009100 [Leishmania donovani]TPP48158.1 hypothetical protein CGC21_12540 [Leishmania donovani]